MNKTAIGLAFFLGAFAMLCFCEWAMPRHPEWFCAARGNMFNPRGGWCHEGAEAP